MGKRRRFTQEFKIEAVRLLEAGSRPASEIARELGVVRNRLYKWQGPECSHPETTESLAEGLTTELRYVKRNTERSGSDLESRNSTSWR